MAGITSTVLRPFDLNQLFFIEQGSEGMGVKRVGIERDGAKEGREGTGMERVEKRD